jgi:hypothetical protein
MQWGTGMMTQEAISVPSRLATLRRETRRAIEAGIDMLRAEGVQATLPASLDRIVFRLLQEAVDVLGRLPDREAAFLAAGERIGWPEVVHDAQERYEAELQRLIDLKETPSLSRLPKLSISDPSAIPRMLTVLSWLRYMRVKSQDARRLKRDKAVLLALAGGVSRKHIRAMMRGCGDSAADMLKQRALRHISTGVKNELLP